MKDNTRRSNTADACARASSLLIRGCIFVSGVSIRRGKDTHYPGTCIPCISGDGALMQKSGIG